MNERFYTYDYVPTYQLPVDASYIGTHLQEKYANVILFQIAETFVIAGCTLGQNI